MASKLYFAAVLKAYQLDVSSITSTETLEDYSCKDPQLETILCDLACDDLKQLPTDIKTPYFDDMFLWQEEFLCYISEAQKLLLASNEASTQQL